MNKYFERRKRIMNDGTKKLLENLPYENEVKVKTFYFAENKDEEFDVIYKLTPISKNYNGAIPADPRFIDFEDEPVTYMDLSEIVYAEYKKAVKAGKLKPLREFECWDVVTPDGKIVRDITHDIPDNEREALKEKYGY